MEHVVIRRKLEGKWEALLTVDGKKVHLGFFSSKRQGQEKCAEIERRAEFEKNIPSPWREASGVLVGRSGRLIGHTMLEASHRQQLSENLQSRKFRMEVTSANTQTLLSRR
jgi:hypothetical protein